MIMKMDMDDAEDEGCNQAVDVFKRQREFQSHLLTQSASGVQPDSEGMFQFVDRCSDKMGVWESHFTTPLRKTNNFVDGPYMMTAI